eukprot:Hpha_TRINITY_DN23390_c0_g1::TRINITY_DN23390_c0_g1_i1::g.96858::m.96858/K07023/K07023; putative hydrolases of HD superfamily
MSVKVDPVDGLEFLLGAGGLKNVPRTGWVESGIEDVESVAEHSWRMAVAALALCPPELNKERVAAVCIVHDLAEATVGDLSPLQMRERGITKERKAQMEAEAMQSLCRAFPSLIQFWREYEDGSSKEGRWAKDLDKLEMAIQAAEYEDAHGVHLQGFFDSVEGRVKDPTLAGVLKVLLERRRQQNGGG